MKINQFNIFGEIEQTDENGNRRFCDYCGKGNNTKTNFCSSECLEKSFIETFGELPKDYKNDAKKSKK